ncbi:MAG: hypothetical protein HQ514_06230 [Rhodospirillales bacterium]|nr:hypothetical protein [Rhodospirillales bacterium]
MQKSVIIADDFYDDAMDVRARALELDYPESDEGYYAGRNSRLVLLTDGIVQMVSHLIGSDVVPSPNSAIGHFRITLKDDKPKQDVHVDPNRDWAGILYLTAPEDCQGGTSFFRHKELGIDKMPSDPEEIRKFGYRDHEHMRRAIVDHDGMDRSKWEETMTVPMRFNRLVLFRSWFWHSFTENFGDSAENGRLIQIFFFDFASRYSQAKPNLTAPAGSPPKPTVTPYNFPRQG